MPMVLRVRYSALSHWRLEAINIWSHKFYVGKNNDDDDSNSNKHLLSGRHSFFFFLGSFFSFLNLFNRRLITLQYCSGFCHTFTWISHGCTCVPHLEAPSHLPPHPIPLGHPSAPALSTLPHASNLDWRSVSHMIIYMFQCYSLKSSVTRLLPQSPKVCSLHLSLLLSHI